MPTDWKDRSIRNNVFSFKLLSYVHHANPWHSHESRQGVASSMSEYARENICTGGV